MRWTMVGYDVYDVYWRAYGPKTHMRRAVAKNGPDSHSVWTSYAACESRAAVGEIRGEGIREGRQGEVSNGFRTTGAL